MRRINDCIMFAIVSTTMPVLESFACYNNSADGELRHLVPQSEQRVAALRSSHSSGLIN